MKRKTDIRPYTRQFYRGNLRWLALGLVEAALMVTVNLVISWHLQQVLDLVSGVDIGMGLTELLWIGVFSCGLIVVTCGIGYFAAPRFLARAMAQYKSYIFEKLTKKSISAFSGESSALYISALSNDAATIEKNYLENIFTIFIQAGLFLGALGMMLWYNPLLTLVALGFSLLPILASLLAGSRLAEAEKKISDLNEGYMSTLRDSLVGFSVIKSFRAEAQMCRILFEQVAKVAEATERSKKINVILQGLGSLASVTVQLGVFLVGAWMALSGQGVTAGTVLVFVQLLNFVLSPIQVVPTCLAQRKAARGLIEKLAQALEGNVRQEGAQEKASLQKGIALQNLSFGYEPEKPVLKNLDFFFEAGKSYALVGASGSGKSTLLNLLMASSHDYSGEICYDDTELGQITSESLYELVSVVQQNVFIFNASIRDNITMFAPFPKEEVDRAIALSGLSALIGERGEDYLCGENGSGLSGGEKQRISIARSLLKKAQVLLVDEATAALDVQTAFQVSSAILDLEGMTRIVVTHALEENLLERFDCILTLKNGTVTEAGTFRELMDRKGYFYSLFTVSQ